jgi:hypothetical protein
MFIAQMKKTDLWCPFSKTLFHNIEYDNKSESTTAYNRDDGSEIPGIPDNSLCLRGKCAVWRQSKARGAVGYCGLAGRLPD